MRELALGPDTVHLIVHVEAQLLQIDFVACPHRWLVCYLYFKDTCGLISTEGGARSSVAVSLPGGSSCLAGARTADVVEHL